MNHADIYREIDENPTLAYGKYIDNPEWGTSMRNLIPDYMQGGLVRWILLGIKPGSFLTALLKGDLFNTYRCADSNNVVCIYSYVQFLYSHAPINCFDGTDTFAAWHTQGGALSPQLKEPRTPWSNTTPSRKK